LADHPGGNTDPVAVREGILQSGQKITATAVDGDERTGI